MPLTLKKEASRVSIVAVSSQFIEKLAHEVRQAGARNNLGAPQKGWSTYMESAKTVAAAEGTIRNRLKKLVDHGIIRVTAIPELVNLGYLRRRKKIED